MSELRDLRHLLATAAYHEDEIERVLDPETPCFVDFDPVLGYVLRDYMFNDGDQGVECDYAYEPHGGHRRMINFADQPCRINTYGDSYTQCAQVSSGETWQEMLAAHFHEPIRNFGVGGYGVYQAYRRALRTEEDPDLAAGYVLLNIWDDDHKRNIDAARWIRVAWMCRDLPRGGKDTYPVHGFPWAHMRYDTDQGDFIELPGFCETAEDLRKLVGEDAYYDVFKDDHVAHLCVLTEGGDAPVDQLEPIAEAFGLDLDLRDATRRTSDARALHLAYGMRSTMWICEQLKAWCEANGRKLMVLLSYDVPTVMDYLEKGARWDQPMLDYLDGSGIPWVDALQAVGEEYEAFKVPIDRFLERFYVGRAGAQVFGHYKAAGNFWFASVIKPALVEWLDPKPPAYR